MRSAADLPGRLPLRTEVWNTMGSNDCPEDAGRALDAAALQTKLGAVRVLPNGPSFWPMDAIVPLDGAADGLGQSFLGATVPVVPVAAGPSLVVAESVPPDR